MTAFYPANFVVFTCRVVNFIEITVNLSRLFNEPNRAFV
jgi:hypothetical protein